MVEFNCYATNHYPDVNYLIIAFGIEIYAEDLNSNAKLIMLPLSQNENPSILHN